MRTHRRSHAALAMLATSPLVQRAAHPKILVEGDGAAAGDWVVRQSGDGALVARVTPTAGPNAGRTIEVPIAALAPPDLPRYL